MKRSAVTQRCMWPNWSKRPVVIAFCLQVVLSGCTGSGSRIQRQSIAVVNNEALTLEVFSKRLADKLKVYDAAGAKSSQNIERAKSEIIADFLQSTLIKQWAKEKGLGPTKEEVDAEAALVRKQYPDDLTFRESLSSQGVTFSEWNASLEPIITQRKLFEWIRKQITQPTDEEMLSYFKANQKDYSRKEQIKISQIVVSKQEKATQVLELLKKGKDFSEVAKDFSESEERTQGGLVGWVQRGDFQAFDEAFSKRPGQFTGVIESPFGYHIIQVLERRSSGELKFVEVKDTIHARIIADREQAFYSKWLNDQIKDAHFSKNAELLKSLRVETVLN
ncbi:MAG: hypothetical protein COT74_04280 [Bdellovibrionales bacterium CG10_big_fil_rev_8_21_14_0_10_45_34]|nr:MAG: hypothetical protein COT74_04280 [Bdellovibrionales bacterium CG10_big_fil_rev_8_21_14_0_10_45_34]